MAGLIITIVLATVCIIGLFMEDKLIAFEDKIAEKIRNHKKKSEN